MQLAKLYSYLQSRELWLISDYLLLLRRALLFVHYLLRIAVVHVESIGVNLNLFVFPVSFLI